MKIKKILNNNTVIAAGESGEEVIVMNPGLGFHKKKGDTIAKTEMQKIFVLQNREVEGQYQQLLKNIDPISSEIAEKIITYAIEQYDMKLNEIIHVTLTDHIDGQIRRLRQNVTLSNRLVLEISRVYPKEFRIGKYGNELIREALQLDSAPDEAAFIALHFVNSQANEQLELEESKQIVRFVSSIVTIVEQYYHIQIDIESLSYYRFMSHLKFLYKRLCDGTVYQDDETLYKTVSLAYPEALGCVNKIVNVILLKYQREVSTEEKAYLTVYVEKLLRDCRNQFPNS